ncbi:sulfatase family protein [Paenarthrobacter aurescens]|uniref:sulfatase family protein n=1 Tax=Paenarthrobacter aurescens TaxID=43663 RepID=UPI0021C0C1AD|nr:sulfatase [Paenarthrobacter aurescens]
MQNILLIHCHDLGRFLGTYGVETVSTPHLDALADESVLFEQAFATAPHCSPARASLFTGTYPQTNGVLGLTHEPFSWDLKEPKDHIAYRLKSVGYQTELVGVHHESRVLADDVVAGRLGFDHARTGGARDVVVDRATDALRRLSGSDRPFYLQVGFTEPHRVPSERDRPGVMGFLADGVEPDVSLGHTVPAHLVDDVGAREEIAELQGAVKHMDEGVGSILAELDSLGLRDQTLVLFTTDHGLALPRAKCTLYDAGLGVALMLRHPGNPLWSGRRVGNIVSHVDVLPTLMDLAGLPTPDGLAGTTLRPAVEAGDAPRSHCFSQLSHHTYYDPKRSVRTSTHKLIVNFSNAPRAMDPTQSWIHRSLPADLGGPTIGTSPALELYDLTMDPEELDNIAGNPEQSEILRDLSAILFDWMRECGDPLLTAPVAASRHELALSAIQEATLTRK